MEDKNIIRHILGCKCKIKNLTTLEHPGKSTIKTFTLVNDNAKYLLKSYPDEHHTDQEIKNLENITPIKTFNKPKYYGKHKNFFIQEFIDGVLFQNLINNNSSKSLHHSYLKAVKNLTIIHTSKNYLKDKRELKRVFQKLPLEKRLKTALNIVETVGLPTYSQITKESNKEWEKTLGDIKLSKIVRNLEIKEDDYFLGHGDYKPNNIIFTKKGEIFVFDWLGMSKAQPWYDLAYLLTNLDTDSKHLYLARYLQQMKEKGKLTNISYTKALDLFKSGTIFQQIIRAKSNSLSRESLKGKNSKHHIEEFRRAMDGLVKEIKS